MGNVQPATHPNPTAVGRRKEVFFPRQAVGVGGRHTERDGRATSEYFERAEDLFASPKIGMAPRRRFACFWQT